MFKNFKIDGFILALFAVLIFSYFFPNIGTSTKPIDLGKISGYGISLIFFFYGLKLSPAKFSKGLSNWKMHVLIQVATFIIFPIIVIIIKPLFFDNNLWLSIFFVATLPSTVSSSVVMVSIAKGNVPAAIFNATISSLGGIFITPLWMGIFMITNHIDFDSSEIISKLIFQILFPIVCGSLLHFKFGNFAEKHNKKLKLFDQTIVLLIVYTSFCKSFSSGIFENIHVGIILGIIAGMNMLFFIVFFILKYISFRFRFNYEDTVTTLFCGSKKSLIHGVVISKVLFAGTSIGGFILVPIMIYHSLQLIAVSFIANKMNNSLSK